MFKGKHTDWLLLSEPDTVITPLLINTRYKQLMTIYEDKINADFNNKKQITDFNLLASELIYEKP